MLYKFNYFTCKNYLKLRFWFKIIDFPNFLKFQFFPGFYFFINPDTITTELSLEIKKKAETCLIQPEFIGKMK